MKKIGIIIFLTIIGISLIGALFFYSYTNTHTVENVILGDEIILPDRIVYKNSNNECFEFLRDSEEYNSLIELISSSLINYEDNSQIISQDTIDTIHNNESFLEFDYKTASKNYIIPLGSTLKNYMIKLLNTGGKICSSNLQNLTKIKSELDKNLTTNCKPYSFNYTELLSKNSFYLDYKYKEQFDEINYRIYQVKIEDIKTYERFEAMCNLSFDEPISEDIFNDNILILTVSSVPKITVKVNIGNIRYTYENLPNTYDSQSIAHLLIVSKIVNTDCIYNTDLSTVDQMASFDEFLKEHDENVENLDENLYVKDFDTFYTEYTNATSSITEEKATEIANNVFESETNLTSTYNKDSQTMEIKSVHPTNLFIRKYYETDYTAPYEVTAYCFRRSDDMGNGTEIYIDNKLGKVIGGYSFGD